MWPVRPELNRWSHPRLASLLMRDLSQLHGPRVDLAGGADVPSRDDRLHLVVATVCGERLQHLSRTSVEQANFLSHVTFS